MPSELRDELDVAVHVGDVLDRIGAQYFLGGSLASSLQGEPRATNDIDLVVSLAESQVQRLADELGADFDVDTEALRDAVRRRSSWNIYHLGTMTKIDLFIARSGAFDQSEFRRRRMMELGPNRRIVVKSPEDTIVRKLSWFREGGEVSSTQWRDVIEVMRVNDTTLDWAYIEGWAGQLGTTELLARARSDARLAR